MGSSRTKNCINPCLTTLNIHLAAVLLVEREYVPGPQDALPSFAMDRQPTIRKQWTLFVFTINPDGHSRGERLRNYHA